MLAARLDPSLGQVGGDTYLRLNDDLALEYFGKKAPPPHKHTHARTHSLRLRPPRPRLLPSERRRWRGVR
jgi:hypothetical protein